MPLTDSIHLTADTTAAVADSLIKNDSIQLNADTVTLTDTIKVVTGDQHLGIIIIKSADISF